MAATLLFVFIAVPLRLLFGLIVAILLNTRLKLAGLFRSAFYLPTLIGGSVAVAAMWRQLFGAQGAINSLLSAVTEQSFQTSWITHPSTAIFSLVLLAGTVISSVLTVYGFARIRFRGAAIWFACMMTTMMLPSEVLTIPQYILFQKLGWINTFKPLIIPSFFGGAFFIFLLIQFLQGIPKELDESAKIDGCGLLGILARILLPLLISPIRPCKPIGVPYSLCRSYR